MAVDKNKGKGDSGLNRLKSMGALNTGGAKTGESKNATEVSNDTKEESKAKTTTTRKTKQATGFDFEYLDADHEDLIGSHSNVAIDTLVHSSVKDLANGLNIKMGKLTTNMLYYMLTHHMDEFKAEMKRRSKQTVTTKPKSLF